MGPGERARTAHPGGPLCRVMGVAVTADGKRAVSASWDKTLKVWDLETRPRTADPGRAHDWVSERGGDGGRQAGGLRV